MSTDTETVVLKVPASIENMDAALVERFRAIVQVPLKFDSPDEEEKTKQLVKELSPEHVLVAARVSYAYWVLEKRNDECIQPEMTTKIATKISRWFLQNSNHHVKNALAKLQEALEFRKEQKLEFYRTCFEKDEERSDFEKELRNDIALDFSKQTVVMRGVDKLGRAIVIKMPRTETGTTEQAYYRAQMYIAERSAAVTEFMSQGEVEHITALFSMAGQNSKNAPPLGWQTGAIGYLQKLYPARVGFLVIIEAPFLIRTVWGALKPFLSEAIRKNTQLVNGKSKREKLLADAIQDGDKLFEEDGSLSSPIDVEEYLHETPFYCGYGFKP